MIGIIVGAGVALASSLTTLLVGHLLDRRHVSAAWLKEQRLAAWVALMDASKGLMKIAADMYEMGSYTEMRPLLSGVREREGELAGAVVCLDVVGPPEIEDLLADFYDAHRPLGEHEAAWKATRYRHRQFNDTPGENARASGGQAPAGLQEAHPPVTTTRWCPGLSVAVGAVRWRPTWPTLWPARSVRVGEEGVI